MLPVIMAGGSGSRLWPLSRSHYPKQFLPLINEHTMLQETACRLNSSEFQAPLIICGEDHRFTVAEQMRASGLEHSGIILEPAGRNTAPAIALAALQALANDPDALLLVLAADHAIQDPDSFIDAVHRAEPLAREGKLVTFGIIPDHAHTGYGYIRSGAPLSAGFEVAEFVEKPDQVTAQSYLDSGSYSWNSGIFLLPAQRYLDELEQYAPEILKHCRAAMGQSQVDSDFIRPNAEAFLLCPEDSIDYAVMEKTTDAAVIPMECGWSDVGSWTALWDISPKDDQGNTLKGDAIAIDTHNCFVQSDSKLVASVGVENLIIVESDDAIMVAHQDQVQKVKKVVEQLKQKQRNEAHFHRKVYRPWGYYDSIDQGHRFQVKRIVVKPGAQLSLQMHHHRAEHWIVVKGTAEVTKGAETFLVTENESTYIPLGIKHRLKNPGSIPLEIVEVQSGSYLGEDDIQRFDDHYGRD